MLPSRTEAERLLRGAELCNPGPWGGHSRVAAACAGVIARACGDLDPEKAYVLGLLHDIGRKFGVSTLRHVTDGWRYLNELGYDEAARVCLTHSFQTGALTDYVGAYDVSPDELSFLRTQLQTLRMDEYDRLIQLCDSIAGAQGVMDMEARMDDVARRYGSYPQHKREANRALRKHFEAKMGADLYETTKQVTV